VIPQIAGDLKVDVGTAALLSTAYTLPYAIVQPVIGMMSDFVGKTRLMNVSLLIIALAALVCAVATDFDLFLGMRIVAGLVAGGVFPVALGLVGDLVPVDQRQVAIGRLLAVGLTGNLIGSTLAGVIADVFGWRGVFAVFGLFGLVIAVVAFFALRATPGKPPVPFNLGVALAGFRSVFTEPRAKVCFTAVFFEALFIHGLFPYVAILLLAAGEPRASIAGILIASFGVGGVVYSLLVGTLVARIPQPRLMIIGGTLAGVCLALTALHAPWFIQIGIFFIFGFGFYLLHACIQVHVTDLSQTARGTAASLHSCFFYLGQATGPVIYGFGFAHGGPEPTLLIGGVVIVTVGYLCSVLLRLRVRTI
jgi:predicted MFS family arabinose efflux permease